MECTEYGLKKNRNLNEHFEVCAVTTVSFEECKSSVDRWCVFFCARGVGASAWCAVRNWQTLIWDAAVAGVPGVVLLLLMVVVVVVWMKSVEVPVVLCWQLQDVVHDGGAVVRTVVVVVVLLHFVVDVVWLGWCAAAAVCIAGCWWMK